MARDFIVLHSFPPPRPTTNPYSVMLVDGLRQYPGVRVLNFSWRTALTAKFDLFHVHWPEILVDGHSPLKKLARQVLTLLLLARLTLFKIPIVRSVHNIGLPEGITARERLILRLFERRTAFRIRLNTATPIVDGDYATIPHGHYRTWYDQHERRKPITGRFGYFGLIRRYKGVEQLVEAFGRLTQAVGPVSLRIGGRPSTTALAETVTTLAGDDPRIELNLNFLSDAQLVDIATSSELVVLPYRFMHNSGGALTALSLDRPVLVPDNEVNRMLSQEVGQGWVYLFDGELTSEQLERALRSSRAARRSVAPDLTLREWDASIEAHVRAYQRTLEAKD